MHFKPVDKPQGQSRPTAMNEAMAIWSKASQVQGHPYLHKRKVPTNKKSTKVLLRRSGIRMDHLKRLIVPMFDMRAFHCFKGKAVVKRYLDLFAGSKTDRRHLYA